MARLAGFGGNVFVGAQVVENCEDAWDEHVDADVVVVLDTADYKVGSASNRFEQADLLAVGDVLATEVVALPTLASYSALFCWAKSSVNTIAADDYRIQLDNHAWPANTPEVQCSLPILVANVWKFCICVVAAGSFAATTLPISVGLKLIANDPGIANMWLDHIVAAKQVAGIRAWSMDVVASIMDTSAYSDGQDKVFTVTTKEWSGSFDGFKDGPPLAIGTVVGLELMEAATVLPIVPTASWRGAAIITNLRPTSSVDGIVGYAYDFQGIHALEWPTT